MFSLQWAEMDQERVISSMVSILNLFLLVSSADNFANSSDPDQARQNVGPDLDPICLTLSWYS